MIIYQTNFDEDGLVYFLIKEGKVFIKYMENLEKVSNIIRNKTNSILIYNKRYLNAEKKKNTKGGFQCLYGPMILIDSIYGKDENYYPEVFFKKKLLKTYNFLY